MCEFYCNQPTATLNYPDLIALNVITVAGLITNSACSLL